MHDVEGEQLLGARRCAQRLGEGGGFEISSLAYPLVALEEQASEDLKVDGGTAEVGRTSVPVGASISMVALSDNLSPLGRSASFVHLASHRSLALTLARALHAIMAGGGQQRVREGAACGNR